MTTPGQLKRVGETIDELCSLSRRELAVRWIKVFGHPPPKGVKRRFLERGLAHRAQCRLLGGLKPKYKRQLSSRRMAGPGQPRAQGAQRPAPGTRLIREWNGKSYAVDVPDTGFRHDGETYKSLSAIARKITGARWSGPRFFGL
ncbi:MAG: DUF2924 domain-containing protein [Pseudomonadota bacterium]